MAKNVIKIIIVVAVTLVLIWGINIIMHEDTGHKETVVYDRSENYEFLPNADSGTSTGIVDSKRNNIIDRRFFKLEQDYFDSTYVISNQDNYKREYLLLFLVNYKISDVQIDGKTVDKFKVSLNSKEAAFVPFKLENLKKGLQDIVILLIPDPNTQNLDEEYRFSTDLSHINTFRFNIAVKGVDSPDIIWGKYDSVKNLPSLDGAILTKSNELVPWLTENVGNKNEIKYKIQVGNDTEKIKKYALITMLNWEQIPFGNNNMVEYGEIPSDSIITYDKTLNIPKSFKKGVSNFTVLYIPEPFRNVEEENFDSQILPTTRVGINN